MSNSFQPDYTLNGDVIVDEASFYTEITRVCNFPGYFGRNPDALNECLGDLAQEHPGAQIWWANVHPYLATIAARHQASQDKTIKKNLLEHMKEICDGHGLKFYT